MLSPRPRPSLRTSARRAPPPPPPSTWLCRAEGLECKSPTGLGEAGSALGGCPRRSRPEQRPHEGLGQSWLLVSGGLWQSRRALGTDKWVADTSESIHFHGLLLEADILLRWLAPGAASPCSLQTPGLGPLRPITTRAGTWPTSADRLPA